MRPPLSFLYTFSFGAGIMLSPDMISAVGRFFGRVGFSGIWILGAGAALYLVIASAYHGFRLRQQATGFTTGSREAGFLRNVYWVIVCARFLAALFLTTGLLVSSGFVFNEVFVYWFPNFGFAFILLGLLVGFQFLPDRTIRGLQAGFAGLAVAGMGLLIIAGLAGNEANISGTLLNSPAFNWQAVALPGLFFIGFDLGTDDEKKLNQGAFGRFSVVILGMTAIFLLWGVTALLLVPQEKLADSTISHMLVARASLGDTGRMVMGAMVIAGSLAAVQALFYRLRKDFTSLFRWSETPRKARWLVLIPGVAVGALMAGGLAGYELLENLIFVTFILWLASYFILLVVGILFQSLPKPHENHAWMKNMINLIGATALAACIILLIID